MGSVLQEKLWVAGKYAIVVIVLLSVLPILLPSAIILSLLFFTFVLPLLCGVAGLFLLQIHAMMLYRYLVAEYEKIIAPALRFAVLLLLGLFREPQSNGVMENAGGPERLREERGNPVVRVAHNEVDLQGPREERVDLEVRVMQNEAVSNWLREQGTDLVLRVMQNEADLQRRNLANLEWPRGEESIWWHLFQSFIHIIARYLVSELTNVNQSLLFPACFHGCQTSYPVIFYGSEAAGKGEGGEVNLLILRHVLTKQMDHRIPTYLQGYQLRSRIIFCEHARAQ
ncbi:hypothetical protein R1flu_014668 [Riccia fluitans]|uniref:Uncharacterized protein n=1 Tax=Riccia fluitans TaxID=41844 RepID=A0ABD1YJV5_9MARC